MKQEFIDTLKNWHPEIKLTVKVRFIKKGSDTPLHGKQYVARLYDRDIFDDDYLGKSELNENGEAHITFYPHQIRSLDSLFEDLPDLYILLFDGDVVHFESRVWKDVDFDKLAKLDHKEGEVLDFGTFLVS
ncbi:MAG: hypothetical protein U0T75_15155 [Chitinophagales bacterium]